MIENQKSEQKKEWRNFLTENIQNKEYSNSRTKLYIGHKIPYSTEDASLPKFSSTIFIKDDKTKSEGVNEAVFGPINRYLLGDHRTSHPKLYHKSQISPVKPYKHNYLVVSKRLPYALSLYEMCAFLVDPPQPVILGYQIPIINVSSGDEDKSYQFIDKMFLSKLSGIEEVLVSALITGRMDLQPSNLMVIFDFTDDEKTLYNKFFATKKSDDLYSKIRLDFVKMIESHYKGFMGYTDKKVNLTAGLIDFGQSKLNYNSSNIFCQVVLEHLITGYEYPSSIFLDQSFLFRIEKYANSEKLKEILEKEGSQILKNLIDKGCIEATSPTKKSGEPRTKNLMKLRDLAGLFNDDYKIGINEITLNDFIISGIKKNYIYLKDMVTQLKIESLLKDRKGVDVDKVISLMDDFSPEYMLPLPYKYVNSYMKTHPSIYKNAIPNIFPKTSYASLFEYSKFRYLSFNDSEYEVNHFVGFDGLYLALNTKRLGQIDENAHIYLKHSQLETFNKLCGAYEKKFFEITNKEKYRPKYQAQLEWIEDFKKTHKKSYIHL